jgi:hypothetical protein
MSNPVLIALFIWTVVIPAAVYGWSLLLFRSRDASASIA